MTTPSASQSRAVGPTCWSELLGHDQQQAWFAHAIRRGRMTGSMLFVGPPGVGKRTTALLLAKTLLCESPNPGDSNTPASPCGHCADCVQVDAGSHPDLVQIQKPADKTFLPLDLLIGPPETRMQTGFCRDIRLKPSRGKRKVAILHDADALNEEGANCLLKTLEEPPPGSLILLIGTSEQKQLPTIRSRCRIVRFGVPPLNASVQLLRQSHGLESSEDQITNAIMLSAGDLRAAANLLKDEDHSWRHAFERQLCDDPVDPSAIHRSIQTRVEAAGKDATKKRAVLREVFSIGVQAYRMQLRQRVAENDALSNDLANKSRIRMDRCVRAVREVDRSANQATLIECFASDLADAVSVDRGAIGS